MSIANIFEVPSSLQQLEAWSFAHAVQHFNEIAAIQTRYNVTLSSYNLDPFNPSDGTWYYQHQVMHDARNRVLGIAGFDLTDVDWQDRASIESWITLHANEHYQASTILQIG